MKPLLRDLSREELEGTALELGAKAFQARSLYDWVWRRGARSFATVTDLPAAVRTALDERLQLTAGQVVERSLSTDGTSKLLLELADGETVEMVLIPDRDRHTLCVSSQVGCPVACVFCASGLDGVRRNLTSAEIVEQFLIAREELGSASLTNLVVMGLGEPLLNFDALIDALTRISDPEGFAFSARRITVSTSGYPDRIRKLAGLERPWNLAVSLHAAEEGLRKELVPTATTAPAALVAAATYYLRTTGRKPTYEIVLLAGRNDRAKDADALVHLLRGVRCTVNLIPWNNVEGVSLDLARPADDAVESFRARLERGGLNVTWRRRRGHDRDAACGQLRLRQP